MRVAQATPHELKALRRATVGHAGRFLPAAAHRPKPFVRLAINRG
jgi:hypothetical protein